MLEAALVALPVGIALETLLEMVEATLEMLLAPSVASEVALARIPVVNGAGGVWHVTARDAFSEQVEMMSLAPVGAYEDVLLRHPVWQLHNWETVVVVVGAVIVVTAICVLAISTSSSSSSSSSSSCSFSSYAGPTCSICPNICESKFVIMPISIVSIGSLASTVVVAVRPETSTDVCGGNALTTAKRRAGRVSVNFICCFLVGGGMWVWYSGVGMWWMREEEEESKDTFCCAKEERKREEGALLTKTRWKRGHLKKMYFHF